MKRRPTRELLDDDLGTPAEIAASLQDLRWFNRWFGGISTTQSLFEEIAAKTRRDHFTVLDLASGEGYVLRTVARELQRVERTPRQVRAE